MRASVIPETETPIKWETLNANSPSEMHNAYIAGRLAGWIIKRPQYCDRGHWQANVECVPDLDAADAFPRYFMNFDRAKAEMEDFLRWRLWKIRAKRPPAGYDPATDDPRLAR